MVRTIPFQGKTYLVLLLAIKIFYGRIQILGLVILETILCHLYQRVYLRQVNKREVRKD